MTLHDNWTQRLKQDFRSKSGDTRSPVRLPDGINFSGDTHTACIKFSKEAVCANMQSNNGAFEGWCLALHRWCGVNVELSWEELETEANVHYERFLYRLLRFNALFGDDWFSSKQLILMMDRIAYRFDAGDLLLNVGGPTDKVVKATDPTNHDTWTEDQWECHLVRDDVKHLDHSLKLGPNPPYPWCCRPEGAFARNGTFTATLLALLFMPPRPSLGPFSRILR